MFRALRTIQLLASPLYDARLEKNKFIQGHHNLETEGLDHP